MSISRVDGFENLYFCAALRELIPMAKQYQHLGWFAGGMILSVFVYGLLARVTVGQTRLIPQ
jgi:hypothetical protein